MAAGSPVAVQVPSPSLVHTEDNRAAKRRMHRRNSRDEKRWLSFLSADDEVQPELDHFSMCRFTCPKVLHTSPEGKMKRRSRAARRKQKQTEKDIEKKGAGGDTDWKQLALTPVETPVEPVVVEGVTECALSTPSRTSDDNERTASAAEVGREVSRRRRRGAKRTKKCPMQAVFGDDLPLLDTVLQLFLLDRSAKVVRLAVADRQESKLLQMLCRCYKLTVRTAGSGEHRVIDIAKTRRSGMDVDTQAVADFVGEANPLPAPIDSAISSPGSSSEGSFGSSWSESSLSSRGGYSRVCLSRRGQKSTSPFDFELHLQAYLDAAPCNRSKLMEFLERCNSKIRAVLPEDKQTETMYERVLRADAWLTRLRESRQVVAARKDQGLRV